MGAALEKSPWDSWASFRHSPCCWRGEQVGAWFLLGVGRWQWAFGKGFGWLEVRSLLLGVALELGLVAGAGSLAGKAQCSPSGRIEVPWGKGALRSAFAGVIVKVQQA